MMKNNLVEKIYLFVFVTVLIISCGNKLNEVKEVNPQEVVSIFHVGKVDTSFDNTAMDTSAQIEKVIVLSNQFLATLTEEQKEKTLLPYSKANAQKWSNFPQKHTHPKRVGIGLGELNKNQLKALKLLLSEILTKRVLNEGFNEVEGQLLADTYLNKMTDKTIFGSDNYFFAFLGQPSLIKRWQIQFGGHHLAISNTYENGHLVGLTPSFRGLEPMRKIQDSNGNIYEPLAQEKLAFTKILNTLSDDEKNKAKISETFKDILMGPGHDNDYPDAKAGIKVSELDEIQKTQIMEVIGLYVNDIDAQIAKEYMKRYENELGDTYFAFSGEVDLSSANDYIRIDGPSIWIEYSVQPARNIPNETHPHSIWRDKKTDYGENHSH